MNMNNPMTDNVELEEAPAVLDLAKVEAFDLLMNENTPAGKAFKVLILDGYLKEEAIRMTSLLGVDAMNQFRSSLFEKIVAIGHFEDYLRTIESLKTESYEDLEG